MVVAEIPAFCGSSTFICSVTGSEPARRFWNVTFRPNTTAPLVRTLADVAESRSQLTPSSTATIAAMAQHAFVQDTFTAVTINARLGLRRPPDLTDAKTIRAAYRPCWNQGGDHRTSIRGGPRLLPQIRSNAVAVISQRARGFDDVHRHSTRSFTTGLWVCLRCGRSKNIRRYNSG